MKILSISIDRTVCDPASSAARRQVAYFQGHEARIIALASGSSTEIVLAPSIVVERIGGRSKPWIFIRALVRMFTLSCGEKIEIVTSQDASYSGFLAWLFSRLHHVPFIVQLHGNYLDNPQWIKQKKSHGLLNALSKWIVRRADGVRCVSERLRRQVVAEFGVSTERTFSMPICTDLSVFSPQGERKEDGPYVLFVGRLHEEKEPFLLCDIMIPLLQQDPALKLVIAGTGHLRDAIEQRFVSVGLQQQVVFAGHLAPTDLAVWYRSATCLLHPSSWEGWGMVMIEAMACGCPVVTTDTGCAGEAVRNNENGFIVPIADESGLRESVRMLLYDADLRRRFSEASIVEAVQWDFADHTSDLVRYAEHVLQRATSKRRLLVTVQAVDLDDALMGFFHEWLVAASTQFDTITVLALRVGRYQLPANITVIPLRPKESRSRWTALLMVWRESWKRRKEYNAVFVRGDVQYVIIAGWLWRLLGKRVILWYAHYIVNPWVLPASLVAHTIATSVPEACASPFVHAISIGQAISSDRFVMRERETPHDRVQIITLGRVTRVKRIEELMESFLHADGEKWGTMQIVGPRPDRAYEQELQHVIQEHPSQIHWGPSVVPYDEIPKFLCMFDIQFSACEASLDKVIVESMLCGVIPIVATDGLRHSLPESLHWLIAKDDSTRVKALKKIVSLSTEERWLLRTRLRDIAMKTHTVTAQIARLISLIEHPERT